MRSRRNFPDRYPSTTVLLSTVIGLLAFLQADLASSQANLPIIPGAEPTEDGLYPLDPSIIGAAWVRPDADLSRYTRVFEMPTGVQFRDVPDRWHNSRSIESADAFFVDEGRKKQMRALFRESFDEALSGVQSFELTDELGRDVVLVQGFLTDVISGVPPYIPGSAITNIRWAWEASIVLEIRDAMSDTILARTAERRRIDGPLDATLTSALTPRIVNDWSRLLVTRLEELRSFYPSRLSRLAEQDAE